jgi:hypothetical protein
VRAVQQAIAVAAYTFMAQPTATAPSPNDCVLIVHQQTRTLETRHCDFSAGKKVNGLVYLVD